MFLDPESIPSRAQLVGNNGASAIPAGASVRPADDGRGEGVIVSRCSRERFGGDFGPFQKSKFTALVVFSYTRAGRVQAKSGQSVSKISKLDRKLGGARHQAEGGSTLAA